MIDAGFDGRVIEILMVEDSEGDARLAREALHDCKIRNALHHVWDGEGAMDFLRHRGLHADAPRPDLILLDLNLPRMDGGEVTPMRPGRTSSCSTSTSPGWTAARCWRKSRRMPN